MPEPYPTMEQVEKATREQIARWHCFLAPPGSGRERDIADRIADRLLNMGGLTPGLTEKIGFTEKPAIPPRLRRRASDVLHIADVTVVPLSPLHAGPEPAANARTISKSTYRLKAS
jgi:hypothetical protein